MSIIFEYEDLLSLKDFDDFHSKLSDHVLNYYDDIEGGTVYNAFGVTTQIVGIDKNYDQYKNTTMKNNLTYIDLGKCVEKIYEAKGLKEGEKLILVKYDSASIPENYLIHPVEYEVFNSVTGEKIDLAICDMKDIIISYPIAELVNEEYDSPSIRRLADAKNIKQLFSLAKKIITEDGSLDSFNPKNKLYNDLCQKCVIDGKDLVLEDRISYLYPENASLCESNCTYLSTDFEQKRINCLCTYKPDVVINRKQKNITNVTSQKEIDDYQKGPTNFQVLKCMEKFEISSNGAFFYMIIILVLELVLCILALSIGYIAFQKKISKILFGDKEKTEKEEKTKSKINPNEVVVDTVNKNLKISSSDRNTNDNIQADPPPKNTNPKQSETDNDDDNNFEINIDQNRNINQSQNQKQKQVIITKSLFQSNSGVNKRSIRNNPTKIKNKLASENEFQDDIYSNYDKTSSEGYYKKDLYEDEDLLSVLKKEKRYKDLQYDTAVSKDKENAPVMVLTFIVDKIYFTSTIFFTRKFDIFSAFASLYLLYHVLVLILITMFFDIKTISKIFFENNFPNISFYLLYGLVCNIIAWIIYRLLACLIKNNNKIINFIARWKKKTDNENNNNQNNKNKNEDQLNVENEGNNLDSVILEDKFIKFKNRALTRLIIYYIIEWAILLFSFFYLCLFCSVYPATKNEVFKTYGISLLEIFLIKVVYATVLGCLRSLSLVIRSRKLYVAIKFFDMYLS